jgi:hypothetical protein
LLRRSGYRAASLALGANASAAASRAEATGEEPMSDDPDFPKASQALQVLRQARLSRNAGRGNNARGYKKAPRRFAPPECFGERINRLFASTMKWRWQRPPPLRLDSGFGSSRRNHAHRWSRDMERDEALKNCANCPHSGDCLKVGSCLDDINAQYLATRPNQFPRLMTPAQATTFMNRLRSGEAVRRITNGGKLGKPVCSLEKLKAHCAAYPAWGAEVHRLAKINAKAGDILKSVNSSKRKQTQEVCLKGLHPMKGDNLMIHKGRRACLACWRRHAANPPIRSCRCLI